MTNAEEKAKRQRRFSKGYYLFEDLLWQTTTFRHLLARQSIHRLQLLAGLVWANEKGRGKCPLVRPCHSEKVSYFLDNTIHLVRKHRHVAGLLHEIAHALGPNDKLTHGPAFRRRCTRLYKLYGEWNGEVDWKEP